MELSVQPWGDSAAVLLPDELLGLLKATLGDRLTVKVHEDGVLLTVKRPAYALADLVAQCDPSAPEPADLAAWGNMKPVGREAW